MSSNNSLTDRSNTELLLILLLPNISSGILVANGSVLLPGDMVACSYSYSITQDDVDAGSWANTAKVSVCMIPSTKKHLGNNC